MGSRVQRQVPKDLDKRKKKASEKAYSSEKAAMKRKADFSGFGYADIIEATQDVEGLTYRPRTAETREVYELILSSIHSALGDPPQDVVRSAADIVLEILKNERMKDFDKKKEIEQILGPIASEQFAQLVNLSKKITDYGADDETKANPDEERKEGELDEEGGVAVVIDEEEQEEEEEEDYEMRDESDEEDEDDVNEERDEVVSGEAPEEDVVIGGGSSRKSKSDAERDVVSPHSIDGFWVQRQISEIYSDPVTAADKAASVISILGSDSSARDCENQLMELFDYESYHVIAKFLKNREVIVWCTKLMRSDADERVNVEVAMREKGLGWILRELAGDRQAVAAKSGEDMDVDEPQQTKIPKTGTIMPGSTVQPKRAVDLEAMSFSQGGHLMSNKKCKLPDGSFKRSKKGYEEIHIPAPKKQPMVDSEIVQTSQLPSWAHKAFDGIKTLNRIQSKVFPVAFGQDDPILLCAPTGAGKVRHSFRNC
jgi:pre-mRNA-splicing helicase BRR2